ncbi:AraC family transcriptional regulator [Bordetella sp. 2513F-2]
MADRLAELLQRFAIDAQVFHAGTLCGHNMLEAQGEVGQLHLIRRGPVEVLHGDVSMRVEAPSLLLYPRPMAHRFVTDPVQGADLVCANLRFEGGARNPISAALPQFMCLPLASVDGAEAVLRVLFDEAFAQRCGRHAVVNRLFEVVMIQVLRQLMESELVKSGMLAGLAHARLRIPLVAMHEAPSRDWSLEELADSAGMSRSAFATTFRDVVGVTPGQYLQGWRIGLAQRALRQGRPLKLIAGDVGYGSEAALSRAFKAHTGKSPGQWRKAHDGAAP